MALIQNLPEGAVDEPLSSTQILARFVASLRSADLPESVRRKLLLNVADTLGVIVGSAGFEHVEIACAHVRDLGSQPRSSVLGRQFKASEAEAAFANGVMAHAIDFDDAHKFVHPGCVVVPAVLALAESRGADGATTVAALAAGYEVAVRVGLAAGPAHRKRGFHPTGTCSVFGAAAGSARVLGLNAEETDRALGLAASFASGIGRYRFDGSANKHIHAGTAARDGVNAALLAARGLRGATDSLEGQAGFLELFADGGEPQHLSSGLGREFQLVGSDIKLYPSCRQSHGAIDLALSLLEEEQLHPETIEEIDVAIYSYAAQEWYARNDPPNSWLEALLRIPYCIAACFCFGRMDLDVFSDEARADPQLQALASRIVVRPDKEFDQNWPKERPVAMRIRLSNGTVLERSLRSPNGSSDRPLSEELVFAKFASLMNRGGKGDLARRAFEVVLTTEAARGINELTCVFQ